MTLADKQCAPCRGGVPPLGPEESGRLLAHLESGWSLVGNHHLEKAYAFKNFAEALRFTNGIGELAEAQNHHPDIHLAWGKVGITIWTHKIDGLTESDFIFAAKCDALLTNNS